MHRFLHRLTLIWAIKLVVQYTKIMYCLDVCTVLRYVPSERMYRPGICTSRRMYRPNGCIVSMHVPAFCMYCSDVCTVPTYVPSSRLYHPDVCTVSTYQSCMAVTGKPRQVVQVDRTGTPPLRLDCPSSRSKVTVGQTHAILLNFFNMPGTERVKRSIFKFIRFLHNCVIIYLFKKLFFNSLFFNTKNT